MDRKIMALLFVTLFLLPLALIPIGNAQIWSWGYRVEFDKTQYNANSSGKATVQFDTITKAQVRNIILRLYLIKSDGQISLQEFEEPAESPIFTFFYEKSFDFQVSANTISGFVYYVISFDIRGPYDPTYQTEVSSMKQGPSINNPSLPAYDSLKSANDSLNSTYNSLLVDYNNLKSKNMEATAQISGSTALNFILALTTIVFIITTIYFATRKPKAKMTT